LPLLLAWVFLLPANAAIPPAEQLLPPDTLLVVTIPDCAKMRGVYNKIPLAQFWEDAAMKPFREKFLAKWKTEFVGSLERDLGVKMDAYTSLPQGQFTFALTKEDWNAIDGNSPAIIILLDAKERSGQLKTNLAELRKKWLEAGKPLKAEKIRGIEFSIVPWSSNGIVPETIKQFFPQYAEIQELGKESPTPVLTDLMIGQHESLLIAGNSIKAIDKVAARLTGGTTPCLGDDASFEANRLARFRDSPFFAWFNAKTFFDVMSKVPPEKPNPQAPTPIPMFATDKVIIGTGLAALRSAAFALKDSSEGMAFEITFDAPEATRKGLFKLLALEPKDCNPPPFVPSDIVRFQRWRLDGQKFVPAFEKMLADISAQLLNSYNFLLSSGNEGVKVHDESYDLRRDLFGNLGDDIIVCERAPRGKSRAELDSPPRMYLIGSPNADKLLASLKGILIILSSQANTPKSREFLGRQILTIKLPPSPIAGSRKMIERELHYACAGGYVALSTDAGMVEEYLRTSAAPTKSLNELAGLSEAAQKVGGQSTGLFTYRNINETIRVEFEALRASVGGPTNRTSLAESLAMNSLGANIPYIGPERSFKEWMDFSLLPPFEAVSKYFYFTVYAGSANVDGITIKYFSPTPPGLKK